MIMGALRSCMPIRIECLHLNGGPDGPLDVIISKLTDSSAIPATDPVQPGNSQQYNTENAARKTIYATRPLGIPPQSHAQVGRAVQ